MVTNSMDNLLFPCRKPNHQEHMFQPVSPISLMHKNMPNPVKPHKNTTTHHSQQIRFQDSTQSIQYDPNNNNNITSNLCFRRIM